MIVEVFRRWAAEKEAEALEEGTNPAEEWIEYLCGLIEQDVCMQRNSNTEKR